MVLRSVDQVDVLVTWQQDKALFVTKSSLIFVLYIIAHAKLASLLVNPIDLSAVCQLILKNWKDGMKKIEAERTKV